MFFVITLVLVCFSALVIAHEFGHFIVAKRNGIKVYEFGIGFPPKLWGKKFRGTLYTVNLLPLGGFVRLEGEDNESKTKTSFATQRLWVQTKVLLAGVTMNFFIAYVIFVILCIVGLANIFPFSLPKWGPIAPVAAESSQLAVFSVGKDSAADKIGLKTGDKLLSVAGQTPANEDELRAITGPRANQSISLTYSHNQEVKTSQVTLGSDGDRGLLGVVAMSQQRQKYPWWQAPIAGLLIMAKLVVATVAAFGMAVYTLLFQFKVSENVAGPVGVTAVFSEVIHFGWDYVAALVASISLSLAVVNALPIPALDGGRLFVLVLRRLGLPIGDKHETWAHTAGFVLLIAFGIIVAISDVFRFF